MIEVRTWSKLAAIGAVTATAIIVGAGIGNARWSDRDNLQLPNIPLGTIAFGARSDPSGDFTFSDAGAPVTVALPGSVIAQVMNSDLVDPIPVTWGFQVAGRAAQSLGLDYTVAAVAQREAGKPDWVLSGGFADPTSVLYYSTLQIYPSGSATLGDCPPENAPPLPTDLGDTGGPHVYIYNDISATVPPSKLRVTQLLVAPGPDSTDSSITEQNWCAAIMFINTDQLPYNQEAWAIGTDQKGKQLTAFNSWNAWVLFPPSLPMAGYYVNTFTAKGFGEDTTEASDSAIWYAEIYPDTIGEPDVIIELNPTVTHIDPAVSQCVTNFSYDAQSEYLPCPPIISSPDASGDLGEG